MKEVNIRQFKPADLETLRELNREVFISDNDNIDDLDLNWPDSELGTKYYTKVVTQDNATGFVAEIDGEPVGYVALRIRDLSFRTSKLLEIENIGVLPEFRSYGIGTKLLEKATEYAKTQKADKLLVEAFAQNNIGLDFYHRFGFIESAITLEKDV